MPDLRRFGFVAGAGAELPLCCRLTMPLMPNCAVLDLPFIADAELPMPMPLAPMPNCGVSDLPPPLMPNCRRVANGADAELPLCCRCRCLLSLMLSSAVSDLPMALSLMPNCRCVADCRCR